MKQTFLRFGDPRKVKSSGSMIHDPTVDLEYLVPDADGPPLQRYESGISVYPVIEASSSRVIFRAPIGADMFFSQLGGFLLSRLVESEIYIFNAVPTGKLGTDDEPLIDKKSITNVRRINHRNILVTERDLMWNIFDKTKPDNLRWHHDMGYDEYFGSQVSMDEMNAHFEELEEKFTNPEQLRVLEAFRRIWAQQIEEDMAETQTINKERVREIVESVLSEAAELVDVGMTPLEYHGYAGTKHRLALIDKTAPESKPNHMFYTDYTRMRKFSRRGKRLKKPVVDEFVKGGPPHMVAFQDWEYYGGEGAIYLNYVHVRHDMRGRGYARKLIQGLIDMHPDLELLHFGKMMQPEIGHIMRALKKKYKGQIEIIGAVNY